MIRGVHEELMKGARTTQQNVTPGKFRTTQNWIGGTSLSNAHFIPPPAHEIERAISDMEKFIHSKDDFTLPVIKAALLHAQFEMIHPFLDGNGRTGRMLITLFFSEKKILEKPLLFLSWYLNQHKEAYYQKLNGYHEGDVEGWVDFFADAVYQTAEESIATIKKIITLREEDTQKIVQLNKRSSETMLPILTYLFQQPIINVKTIRGLTGYTEQGAQNVIKKLIAMKILEKRFLDKKYGQSYVYKRYFKLFDE